MKNVFNKTNAPYLAVGALATLALVSSGVFAVAPYIGFLAPVAALSVGLPFIIGCAVFSVVTIVLSCKAISKNKIISEKDVQLSEKEAEVKAKDKIISEREAVVQDQKQTISELEAKIQAQEQTISGQNDQLTKKEAEVKAKEEENSKQKIEINKKNEEINNQKKEIEELKHKKTFVPQAMKDIQTASEKAFTSTKEAFISGRVTRIVKDGLKDVYGAMPSTESVKGTLESVGSGVKSAYGVSSGYTIGALESVGSGVKSAYDTSVGYAGKTLSSVGSSLYSRFCGTKVSSPEEQFEREDGSKLSMQELTHLDYLDLVVPSSEQKQRANSLDYLNIDNVPKQHAEDQDVFYDAESGDEKGTEISSPESQPAEKEETKVSGYFNQVVSTANWLASQATKAMPYLAASYLPYAFYNYATTPVSASFDAVNVTQSFVANQCTSMK